MAQKKLNNFSIFRIKKFKSITNSFLHNYTLNYTFKNRFCNIFMKNGYKNTSELIFVNFLKLCFLTCNKNILNFVKYSIINSSLLFFLKASKKRDIPFFLKKFLRQTYAVKTIKKIVLNTKALSITTALNKEFFNIMQKSSIILSSNDTTLKDSVKKKSNAHFRWF